MTTCVAVWTPEETYVAADRRALSEAYVRTHGRSKIEQMAPWLLIAVAGGSRALRLLDSWKVVGKVAPKSFDEARLVVQKSADALWEKLGWPQEDSEEDTESPDILCVTPWGLFSLSTGGTVWPHGGDTLAMGGVGSGQQFAMGSLSTSIEHGVPLRDAIELAIHTAAKFDVGTGNGVTVMGFSTKTG